MKKFNKILPIILISLIGIIPFIPDFGSIDLQPPQFLFIGITQLLTSIYLLLSKRINKIYFNKMDLFYLIFLLFALISITKSENIQESTIILSRYFTLFITYFNLKLLFEQVNSKLFFISILIALLTLESLYTFSIFINNYSFDNGLSRIRELQGFSSNPNIGAFSILIKLPILLYCFFISKKLIHKFFINILILITSFNIFIISSRAAILGLFFLVLALILSLFYKRYQDPKFRGLVIIFGFSVLITFLTQNYLYYLPKNNQEYASVSRISNFQDNSIDERIRFSKAAIDLFLENPFLGIGIGNWKITSLNKLNKDITEYTVPFHTHNDFLQIASETGIFGIIFFFLFFFYPLFFLIKKILIEKNKEYFFYSFLVLSILIYLWDSLINFPRLRPYSQMNVLFIFSLISMKINRNHTIFSANPKKLFLLFLLFLVPLNYLHARVFKSYKEIFYLYYDFNVNGLNLELSSDEVKDFEENIPNITNTTIPIKLSKANYYLQEKKYGKALELIYSGQKYNPHLGFGDYLLSKVYYEQNKKDSALYFIEKAFSKVPKNSAHVVLYQTILNELNNFEKEEEVFESVKNLNHELIWSNHFFILLKRREKYNYKFNSHDIENIENAVNLFPKNPLFKSFSLLKDGNDSSIIVSKLDVLASSEYKNKNYIKAIEYWEKASEIVPLEDSYILNIALSFCQINQYYKAIEKLKVIETRKTKSSDGQFEFISGVALNGIGSLELACKYIRASKAKGYKPAEVFLKNISCLKN